MPSRIEQVPKERTHRITFLDLPAELRNRVYDLLLRDEGFRVVGLHHPFRRAVLDQVSRQTRAEFLPFYYTAHSFLAPWAGRPDPRARQWLDVFGEERIPLLKRYCFITWLTITPEWANSSHHVLVVLRGHLHGFKDVDKYHHTKAVEDEQGRVQVAIGGDGEQDVALVADLVERYVATREDGTVFLPVKAVTEIADALRSREGAIIRRF